MTKTYRVTPKNGKWIIQKISDRSTVSAKPFIKKSDAEDAMYAMIVPDVKDNTIQKEISFKAAFKKFADWKLSLKTKDNRIDNHSLKRYDTEYRQRISKYMDDKVLLSKFNILDMENYLENCQKHGVPFKTMRKSVKDIKHFLRRANAVGLEPKMDMLTYNILDNHKVVPQDDDLIYKKEIDIDVLPDEKIKEIIDNLYHEGINAGDINTANAFAIFCLFFFFGLRASELSAIHRDFHQDKSCVDFDNALLHIRGTIRNHQYQNKTKNRGSRRPIPIDANGMKFLEIWFHYLDGREYRNDRNNKYLLPGKNGGPLCYKTINGLMWKTYAKHGLAEIKVARDGHVTPINSPLKGFTTKIFRHRLATNLMDNMHQHKELGRNRVKSLIGHTQFSTSAEIYGNKVRRGTDKERAAVAEAKAKATGSNIFSKVIENN